MKLYSNIITEDDIKRASRTAGVVFQDTFTREGWFIPIAHFTPRKFANRGFTFYLSGSSAYNSAHDRSEKAATWDEHGVFMAELFKLDPEARIAHYKNAQDFVAKTREERDRVRRGFAPTTRYYKEHKAPWLQHDELIQLTP